MKVTEKFALCWFGLSGGFKVNYRIIIGDGALSCSTTIYKPIAASKLKDFPPTLRSQGGCNE